MNRSLFLVAAFLAVILSMVGVVTGDFWLILFPVGLLIMVWVLKR